MKKLISFLKTEKSWVLLDQLAFSATSFITTVLLARLLGIEQFGRYSLVILYLYLLLSLSNALIVAPFQVLVAKEKNRDAYMGSLLILQAGLILVLSIATLFLFQIDVALIRPLRQDWISILLLLAGFLGQDFFRRIFLATQKAKAAFITDALSGILQLGWLGLSALQGSLSPGKAIFIIAVTYLPAILTAFCLMGKMKGAVSGLKKYARLHAANGKWLLLTSFLQWWSNNFLVAASGLFLGASALGALRLAQTIFGVLNALLQVLENYALPTAATLVSESREDLRRYLLGIGKKGLFLLLPAVAICLFFAKPIFTICGGAAYTDYAYALQGMALLYLFIFTGYPLRIAIRVLLLNRDFFLAYCISFLFSLLFARMLIAQWQLGGVILALIINQILMLGYWQYVLARQQFKLWK